MDELEGTTSAPLPVPPTILPFLLVFDGEDNDGSSTADGYFLLLLLLEFRGVRRSIPGVFKNEVEVGVVVAVSGVHTRVVAEHEDGNEDDEADTDAVVVLAKAVTVRRLVSARP